MLDLKTEKILEEFVNKENLNEALNDLLNIYEVQQDQLQKVVVVLGHDSRPSA